MPVAKHNSLYKLVKQKYWIKKVPSFEVNPSGFTSLLVPFYTIFYKFFHTYFGFILTFKCINVILFINKEKYL